MKSIFDNVMYIIGDEHKKVKSSKRTTPGIPTWSPTVVLTRPDNA